MHTHWFYYTDSLHTKLIDSNAHKLNIRSLLLIVARFIFHFSLLIIIIIIIIMDVSRNHWLCVKLSLSSPSPARSHTREITQRLCLSFFFYIKDRKRRRIQPPDENESVVVFAQPPRDELFSLLNDGSSDHDDLVPLTTLENDSIRKLIQEHPETCREKYPFEWDLDAYHAFPRSAVLALSSPGNKRRD
jgi:hypothetical protein